MGNDNLIEPEELNKKMICLRACSSEVSEFQFDMTKL